MRRLSAMMLIGGLAVSVLATAGDIAAFSAGIGSLAGAPLAAAQIGGVAVFLTGALIGFLSLRPVGMLIAASVVGVLAAIALPGLMRACACGGNEASAIGSLRAINSGQASYSSSCAAGGYAVDLVDLVKAPSGSSQGFVSPDLNRNGVIKSEYIITLSREAAAGVTDVGSAASTCNDSLHQPASAYFASANPKTPGTRYFATDTRGTIYFSTTGPVPNPIPPNTSVVQ